MKNRIYLLSSVLGILSVFVPVAAASAASATIQSLSPGTNVLAKNSVTFTISTSGFQSQTYIVSDSFGGSTASANNIDPGGKFTWTPLPSDVGTHTITITVNDNSGSTATVTQTITVAPPPSVSITSVVPGPVLMPGSKYSFTVVPTGFTNPTYVVGDDFSGSSASIIALGANGNFAWTPDMTQNGSHTLTIYASDSLGHSAQANVTVQVGSGPSLTLLSLLPGSTVTLGQSLTFTAIPQSYSPTGFTVSDSFKGVSSITGANINSAGQFSWTPQGTETGTHVLTVVGSVGAYGQTASVKQTIFVGKPGETAPTAGATSTLTVGATSTSALSTLQAQLAALQVQIAAHAADAATTIVAPVPIPDKYVFTKLIKFGNTGKEVLELQKALTALGLFSEIPNGRFGKVTEAAVKKFQKAHGLSQFGYVGPGTRAALNK